MSADDAPSVTTPAGSGQPPAPEMTEGVRMLLGDPKKAVIRLAIPMMAAVSVQVLYSLVNAFWVAGLGTDALSAVGFFFPFYYAAIALSTGFGIGASAALSRRIGAKDKKGADAVAMQTLVLLMTIAVVITIPLIVFAEDIFRIMGAGEVTGDAALYARIMFVGSVPVFFANVAVAILRGEGDVKRAMWALLIGGVLNLVLDPLFIYTFGLGVAGAAVASVIALTVTALILYYWLFIKRNTYVHFDFKDYRFDWPIVKDILRVGLPSAVIQLSMSLTMLAMNFIVAREAGSDGVAIYSTGWRVTTLATLPLVGMASAVVTVTGAAFGQKDFSKLNVAYMYAIKVGLVIEVVVGVLTFIFAPQIAGVFARTEDASERIKDDLVLFLRVISLYYPGVAFGMTSSSMFQGVGKGMNALTLTIFRTIILTVPLAWLLTFTFGLGLLGSWIGIVVSNLVGSMAAFMWGRWYLKRILSERIPQVGSA